MGYSAGKATFAAGTGSKTIVTGLTGAPTGCRITCSDTSSANLSVGTSDGTNQACVAGNSPADNTLIMQVKSSGGTALQNASWTSFGASGGAGTVTFNVTPNANFGFILEVWN